MKYIFYIETSNGILIDTVQSSYDFSGAPFGFTSYRGSSTCELPSAVVDDFWDCIDIILIKNNLTPQNFIRAIRAYCNDVLYGETEQT